MVLLLPGLSSCALGAGDEPSGCFSACKVTHFFGLLESLFDFLINFASTLTIRPNYTYIIYGL